MHAVLSVSGVLELHAEGSMQELASMLGHLRFLLLQRIRLT